MDQAFVISSPFANITSSKSLSAVHQNRMGIARQGQHGLVRKPGCKFGDIGDIGTRRTQVPHDGAVDALVRDEMHGSSRELLAQRGRREG